METVDYYTYADVDKRRLISEAKVKELEEKVRLSKQILNTYQEIIAKDKPMEKFYIKSHSWMMVSDKSNETDSKGPWYNQKDINQSIARKNEQILKLTKRISKLTYLPKELEKYDNLLKEILGDNFYKDTSVMESVKRLKEKCTRLENKLDRILTKREK